MDVIHFMRRPRPNMFSIERVYQDVRTDLPDDCHATVWTCGNFSNGFWPRLQDAVRARGQQADVNHVTGDVHYLALLLDPQRTVLTVHDLVSLGRLRGLKRWVFWLVWYWAPVRLSRLVVVISQSTRRQLLESVRCDPAKIRVIHNPVSDEFRPAPRPFDPLCPKILLVGTNPNKNIERVAEALSGIPCRVTIIGAPSAAQIEALARHGVDHEAWAGLSLEALVEQYVQSDMLVFASTYEGFGLPIVEAQAVGRPVVTSNILSMPEVAGDAACLVDPFDVASIRAGIVRLIQDAAYRGRLVEAGFHNAARFRGDAVAEAYAAVYREVDAGRRAAP